MAPSPRRLLPLSKGRLQGDTVVCGYHGLKFDPQGRCTFMPSQETINPSACVRAYPAVERHRYIWLSRRDDPVPDAEPNEKLIIVVCRWDDEEEPAR